ncbi:hypothetical protein OCO53_07695 [Peribacillus frigoritolerans]|nr:hypothetical protein [Peribacillus frigoritolerans]MCU6600341.1 hypothetical protein [Peribacillus frigoritolerans]
MKEENEAIPSIHNTDLHKALQHVSEQFKVSLPELRLNHLYKNNRCS